MPTFPNLIHVTEEAATNDEPWLQVRTDGVASCDEPGQKIAIYRLVEVGRVGIAKSFLAPRRGKKRK